MTDHTFSFAWVDDRFEVDINPKDLPGLEEKVTGATWRSESSTFYSCSNNDNLT